MISKYAIHDSIRNAAAAMSNCFEARQADQATIDQAVNQLILSVSPPGSTFNIASHREDNRFVYISHLGNLAGIVSEERGECTSDSCTFEPGVARNLEGWDCDQMLPMRICSLFKLAVKITKKENQLECKYPAKIINHPRFLSFEEKREEIVNLLVKEIFVELKTFDYDAQIKTKGAELKMLDVLIRAKQRSRDYNRYNQNLNEKDKTGVQKRLVSLQNRPQAQRRNKHSEIQLLQDGISFLNNKSQELFDEARNLTNQQSELIMKRYAIVEPLLKDILSLEDGQEVSFSTGSLEHQVYVSFFRLGDEFFLRIDNAGEWSDNNKFHNRLDDKFVYPCLKFLGTKNDLLAFPRLVDGILNYLGNILQASLQPSGKAKQLIYSSFIDELRNVNFTDENSSNAWPAHLFQRVGNCVLISHDIGMLLRLNQYSSLSKKLELGTWVRVHEMTIAAKLFLPIP